MPVTPLKPDLAAAPSHAVHVDLDERSFLFPAGKNLTRLVFSAQGQLIHLDAIYGYNQSRTPPRILTLSLPDAQELARLLVETVFLARTQHAITDTMRITLEVMPNGYRWQIGDINRAVELYLGAACIWRVCQGLLRIIDFIAPVEAH